MPWNPDTYNQFKNIRYQPFFDLMELISSENLKTAIDIGCGTGEQTHILAQKFDKTKFLGIDSSPEMLAKSKEFERDNLYFKLASVEEFTESHQKYDLIFSNAALQWSDKHDELFPQLISQINENGQFAVQMPVQRENILNKILIELVQEKPFNEFLNGWKREPTMLGIDEYAQIMFDDGLNDIQIVQKVYPLIAEDVEELFDFISGSALIPYMERFSEDQHEFFVAEYKSRIQKSFKKFPAIYAFKRLLLYGRKG
ncbi:methyltransferase domain-containing protein [Moheibacter sediminis]|uniref:Trans-aconitate 2-methyltransferase n=1 Tax=Moheibacter sediminis TaxID=1434700 RepID=A0A1W1YN29_9FLAO|nr:methyltransferase domain-containing protein [Moheibacter sediminis]SMC37587.1 trans-aconitate 2-methyltransferase [Moheibacter sediminis]